MNSATATTVATAREPAPTLRRALDAVALLTVIGCAFFYALTSIAAICNFSFRQLQWDQYRNYGRYYLPLDFPENAVQLENGHRPIVPVLLRLAEIAWGQASQLWQIGTGTFLAVFTVAILALLSWREKTWPVSARACGVFVGVVGVLWMANARMLLHGNEMLHVYTISTTLICGTLCLWRSRATSPALWGGMASSCAMLATFSFGPGIATFPALLVLATMLRTPRRVQAVLAASLAGCLALYVFALPGDDGVRGMLHFRPIDSFVLAARWLSSPWVNAWLGLGEDPIHPWLVEGILARNPHSLLVGSARAASAWGLGWNGPMPTLIGTASLGVGGWAIARRLHRWTQPSRLELVACALVLFGGATAAVIGIGRVDQLSAVPSQVFADRYLVWPCLYWTGLALLGLAALSRSRAHVAAYFAPVACVLLAVVLVDNQRGWTGWGAAVFRHAERSAAAARSGVHDPRVFPDNDAASQDDVVRTLDLMRRRDLGMFAEPSWHRRGQVVPGPARELDAYRPEFRVVDTFVDPLDQLPCAHLEGWFPNAHGAPKRRLPLAVVDSGGVVVGFAQFSFIAPNAAALRVTLPVKKGFDAYIRGYRPTEEYRLVALDESSDGILVLAHLPGRPMDEKKAGLD